MSEVNGQRSNWASTELILQRFLGHRSIQEEMREQKKNEKHATVKPV